MLDTNITSIVFVNTDGEILGMITDKNEIVEKDGYKILVNRKEVTD